MFRGACMLILKSAPIGKRMTPADKKKPIWLGVSSLVLISVPCVLRICSLSWIVLSVCLLQRLWLKLLVCVSVFAFPFDKLTTYILCSLSSCSCFMLACLHLLACFCCQIIIICLFTFFPVMWSSQLTPTVWVCTVTPTVGVCTSTASPFHRINYCKDVYVVFTDYTNCLSVYYDKNCLSMYYDTKC